MVADAATVAAPKPRQLAWWRDTAAVIGIGVVLLLVLLAILAPYVAPHDPVLPSLRTRLRPPVWLEGGSWRHVFGTDHLGRDILSRIIYGSRASLIAGVAVVAIAGSFGTVIGLVSGFRGGRVDTLMMRWVDVHIAFPGLLISLLIIAVLKPSLVTVVIALSINGWMVFARLVRSIVLSARQLPYVEAAEVIGCRPSRTIFRHILPNLAAPLMTLAVLEFARIVLAEAALSFLGVGIQPPATSWGLDVSSGRNYLFNAWWVVTFPGLAITITVLGINFLAGWLRVVVDPYEGEKRFARAVANRET
jgi:peptide/nickel transport system permease protein